MNIVIKLLLFALIYILWMPFFFKGIPFLLKMLKSRLMNRRRTMQQRNQPVKVPFSQKLMAGVKFEIKGDNRPVSKKTDENGKPTGTLTRTNTFRILWGLGLGFMFAGAFMPLLIIPALILSIVSAFFAYSTSKGLLQEKELIMKRMYETKRDMMGLVGQNTGTGMQGGPVNYNEEFVIKEWAPDNKQFNKILLYIPTRFDQLQRNSVIEKMNQNFGGGTAWVADTDDEETHGWDFVAGKVTLKRTPELPHIAPWDEHYVLDDRIAWSFFPLGLGVENGVELVNPKTGETENVLGFDLQGKQQKIGQKQGFPVGPELIAAPQVLIARRYGRWEIAC